MPICRNFAVAFGHQLVALVSVSANVRAAPTLLGTRIDPTGINGLVIDGTSYDVTFATTGRWVTPFVYGTPAGADAATALATALSSLDVTGLGGNPPGEDGALWIAVDEASGYPTPADVAGCFGTGAPPYEGPCYVHAWFGGQEDLYGFGGTPGNAGSVLTDFASFMPARVPEPTTLSLLAFGLAGIACAKRRKAS